MSETIKRLMIVDVWCSAEMLENSDGDYVRYTDHARIVAEKDEVIQKMALIIQAVGPSKLEDPVKTAVAAAARQFDSTVSRHVAAAYRQGQDAMLLAAISASACPHCNGTGSFAVFHGDEHGNEAIEERQCCNPQEHADMIERIRAIPLKENP